MKKTAIKNRLERDSEFPRAASSFVSPLFLAQLWWVLWNPFLFGVEVSEKSVCIILGGD